MTGPAKSRAGELARSAPPRARLPSRTGYPSRRERECPVSARGAVSCERSRLSPFATGAKPIPTCLPRDLPIGRPTPAIRSPKHGANRRRPRRLDDVLRVGTALRTYLDGVTAGLVREHVLQVDSELALAPRQLHSVWRTYGSPSPLGAPPRSDDHARTATTVHIGERTSSKRGPVRGPARTFYLLRHTFTTACKAAYGGSNPSVAFSRSRPRFAALSRTGFDRNRIPTPATARPRFGNRARPERHSSVSPGAASRVCDSRQVRKPK